MSTAEWSCGPASVVVFGGRGFLGRHVCAAFVSAGAHVVAAGRAEAAPERLDALLRETAPQAVVNAAGAVWGVGPEQMRESNARFPARLVAALATLPRPPRLVHLGSVHEYGPVPRGLALTEDLPPHPDSTYGQSKLLGTRAVLNAVGAGLPQGVVLRIGNVSGPGSPRESLLGSVAARLAEARCGGETGVTLRLGPLRAHRDFVDARDAAAAVLMACRAPRVGGEVVNIGRGQAVSVRRLVHRLARLSGLDVSLAEDRQDGGARGSAEWQQVDIARAARLLAWRPRIGLDLSLRDLLASAAPRGVEADSSGTPQGRCDHTG